MDIDNLKAAIDRLLSQVGGFQELNVEGLKNTMFPDHVIFALHNHLGNIRQLIYESGGAFNATDQVLAFKGAEREMGEITENLLVLHQAGIMKDASYQYLSQATHEVAELLHKASDPDYK